MYSAIFTIENHNPQIKFLTVIFRGKNNYLHVDTIPTWKSF